jgi:hypothetical protein
VSDYRNRAMGYTPEARRASDNNWAEREQRAREKAAWEILCGRHGVPATTIGRSVARKSASSALAKRPHGNASAACSDLSGGSGTDPQLHLDHRHLIKVVIGLCWGR